MAKTDAGHPWTVSVGVPASHLVRAAIHAAGLIDSHGSPIEATAGAYSLYPSDGLFPPQDLRLGEQMLIDCGLLSVVEAVLVPAPELSILAALDELDASLVLFELALRVSKSPSTQASESQLATSARALIPDFERREALLLAMARRHEASRREEVGALGELCVVGVAKEELEGIGRSDLAARVRRLSEISDQLGYDVVAPRLLGVRRLEVKTSAKESPGLFHFYISRSEFDRGLIDPDWALVGCILTASGEATVAGWCRATSLLPYAPDDGTSAHWASAELSIPVTLLQPGLPPVA